MQTRGRVRASDSPQRDIIAAVSCTDFQGSLDDLEVKIRRYDRTCGEVLSGRVKIAVVQNGIEDEDLRRHVLMHASRCSTCHLVREEIRSIIMARDTLSGLTPMDVSAVYKGNKKGKEKDPAVNSDAEVICYHCCCEGRRKRDCRTMEKDKCKKSVNAVEQTLGQAAEANPVQTGTPARISMIELDDWILMVNIDDNEAQVGSIERVMVDSEAAVSACPLGYAPEIPIANSSRNATLRNASEAQIEHAGQKMVEYEHGNG